MDSSSCNSSPTSGKHVDEYEASTMTGTTAATAATATNSTPRGLRARSSRWHLTSEANLLTSIAALNVAALISAVACASAGELHSCYIMSLCMRS
jgi:hypothetical protein